MSPSRERLTRKRIPIVVAGSFVLGAAIVKLDVVIALLVPAMVGLLLLIVLARHITRWPDDPAAAKRVLAWTIGAFVLHFLLSLIISGLSFDRSDALNYHTGASAIVHHWRTGLPGPVLTGGKEGYYYLLSGLFWVLGEHDVAGLVVNAVLAAALVPLVTDSTRRLFGPGPARYVPPLVVLMPGLLLWTSQLLKEAGVVFLIAAAATCAIRLRERFSFGALVGMTLSVALLFTFRSYVGLVVAAGLVLGIVLGGRSLVAGMGAGAGALLLVAAVVSVGLGYSGYKAATSSNLQQANVVRQDLASSANSGFGTEADISTPQRALAFLPQGLASFVLGPFPWKLTGPRQLLALPDTLVWWALLPSLWLGLRTARRRRIRPTVLLVLPALACTLLLSLALGNYGTIVRERTQVVILLIPLIALGLSERAARKRRSEEEGGGPAVGPPSAHEPILQPGASVLTR